MQALTLRWPGGEHAFRLRIGELRALQEARGAGPEEIFNRLRGGRWHLDDLVQVIRWGLVGGENGMADGKVMTSAAATQMVLPLVDLHPLADFKLPALAILGHALFGSDPDDRVGEPGGAAETPPES